MEYSVVLELCFKLKIVFSLTFLFFTGPIPKELGQLTALQQLNLSYNNLAGEKNTYRVACMQFMQ